MDPQEAGPKLMGHQCAMTLHSPHFLQEDFWPASIGRREHAALRPDPKQATHQGLPTIWRFVASYGGHCLRNRPRPGDDRPMILRIRLVVLAATLIGTALIPCVSPGQAGVVARAQIRAYGSASTFAIRTPAGCQTPYGRRRRSVYCEQPVLRHGLGWDNRHSQSRRLPSRPECSNS